MFIRGGIGKVKVTLYATVYEEQKKKDRRYAREIKGKLQWHLSLHLDTDLVYWSLIPNHKGVILIVEPQLSLSFAIDLLPFLQHQTGQIPLHDAKSYALLKLKDWLQHHCPFEQRNQLNSTIRIRLYKISPPQKRFTYQLEKPSQYVLQDHAQMTVFHRLKQTLAGRALVEEELSTIYREWDVTNPESSWKKHVQLLYLLGDVHLMNGIETLGMAKTFTSPKTRFRCRRCGSRNLRWTSCYVCASLCPYCEACLTLARSRKCTLLILGTPKIFETLQEDVTLKIEKDAIMTSSPPVISSCWNLSPAQTDAATKALHFLVATSTPFKPLQRRVAKSTRHRPSSKKGFIPRFLIWAVTGAGKTEMLFPLIDYELKHGRRVAVVTPRRDVVLELAPRMQKAFPQYPIPVLYGGSSQRWGISSLILATTHQLIRFWQAFDCIIIDELDAFPFHNNPILAYAAEKACKPSGRYLFLSATPPVYLLRQIRRKQVEHVKVPVRYHGYPLPVPKWVRCPSSQHVCQLTLTKRRQLQSIKILQLLSLSLQRGAQIFLFVARIRLVDAWVNFLRSHFPHITIEGTHAQDECRADKVEAFRKGTIMMLVTTTILERGVTVPKTDVFVLDADHRLFDETSLVQIAGRAGRSIHDPAGNVYFLARDLTRSMARAIKQVKKMNRLAWKKGYLIHHRQV